MRDKKDNATFDLPGVEQTTQDETVVQAHAAAATESRRSGPRPRRVALKQEQISLLDDTDASGLPVWTRDPALDLTGLPIWQPDT
jgi:hypothetical protein